MYDVNQISEERKNWQPAPHESLSSVWRRRRINLGVLLTSVAIAVAAQVSLKAAMNEVGTIDASSTSDLGNLVLTVASQPLLWIGLLLLAASGALWLIVLSRIALSFAYPFVGLGYVFVVALSRLLLGEDVPPARWAGALLVAGGIVLIGLPSLRNPDVTTGPQSREDASPPRASGGP